MLQRLVIPFTLAVLLALGMLRVHPAETAGVNAYHAHVAELIETIPLDNAGWIGIEVPIPQSATSLLRPNALVSRRYVHADREVSGTLMVVQCRDARDMAGHYPPQCYPANGWLLTQNDSAADIEINGRMFRRYPFTRKAGREEQKIDVYSIFVLPTGRTSMSMDDVYRLSSDMENRHLGAAQVQFLVDQSLSGDDLEWLLNEFGGLVEPVIDAVESPDLISNREEGSGS